MLQSLRDNVQLMIAMSARGGAQGVRGPSAAAGHQDADRLLLQVTQLWRFPEHVREDIEGPCRNVVNQSTECVVYC
jgi:hypothetical protein